MHWIVSASNFATFKMATMSTQVYSTLLFHKPRLSSPPLGATVQVHRPLSLASVITGCGSRYVSQCLMLFFLNKYVI